MLAGELVEIVAGARHRAMAAGSRWKNDKEAQAAHRLGVQRQAAWRGRARAEVGGGVIEDD